MPWPITNPTYGTYNWMLLHIGQYLGFGEDYNTWTQEQTQRCDDILQSGLTQFYFPPKFPNQEKRHKWSFLTPTSTITLVSGTVTYDLPADFNGSLDQFTLPTANGGLGIPIIHEADMRNMRSVENASAANPPKFAAIRPKTSDGTASQRYEALFYPTPTTAPPVVTFRYQTKPAIASTTALYPYGGTAHVETMMESCLAFAEVRITKKEDVHCRKFTELLSASIELDNEITKADIGTAWKYTEPTYGTYQWLQREVGGFLFQKWNPDTLGYSEDRIVNSIIQRGVRQFYNPPIIQGQESPYEWSFLRPVATLSTANATYQYTLPTDFGTIIDNMTITTTGQKRLQLVDSETLRSQRSVAASGKPLYYAVTPSTTDMTSAQGWTLSLYPTPDAIYTLEYQYKSAPADLSLTNLYPLGTKVHAETLLESCLCLAEIHGGKPAGEHKQRWMDRLAASMQIDKRSSRHAKAIIDKPPESAAAA